jgi:hypothetical protein
VRQEKLVAVEYQILKPRYLHNGYGVFFKAVMRNCVILLLQDIRNKVGERATGARGFLEKLKYFRYALTIYCPQDFLEIC